MPEIVLTNVPSPAKQFSQIACDGKIRLTVDCDRQFAGVPHDGRPAMDSLPPVTPVIKELKFEPQFSEHVALFTNALPFGVVHFSQLIAEPHRE